MNDRDTLYALFEQSPGDLVAYGAMADLLEADGWSTLTHAFRWMWKRGKYPHKRTYYCANHTRNTTRGIQGRRVPESARWAWYAERSWQPELKKTFPFAQREPHALNYLLLAGEQRTFATHQQAVMYLASMLANLGNVYNIEPPREPGLPLSEVLDTGGIKIPPLFDESTEGILNGT